MDFAGKKVSVIGSARSGLASAIVLSELGADVFLSEINSADKFPKASSLLVKRNIKHEFGGHSKRVYDCQLIIVSPGVPADSNVLNQGLEKNIKIISELELGFQLCKGKIIAITGSNGKTTTTSLIGEIFRQTNISSEVAGNIGKPFVSVARNINNSGWGIIEVSTFQLEWIDKFKPSIAAVLNITPDHLDRHKTMENYIAFKLKVFSNQNGTDKAILNYDDKYLKKYKSNSEILNFSNQSIIDNGCYVEHGSMYIINHGKKERIIDVKEIGIKGPHNISNACAAAVCCFSAGIGAEQIAAGLKSFAGVEHRLEKAGNIGAVSFINDSKATNVDAVYWALQSVAPPIVLIAGGRDKGGKFDTLNSLVSKHVKDIVLIGEAAEKIASAFESITKLHHADSMDEAVKSAYELAYPKGTVLLSPGCASFDMYDNYEQRGEIFKNAVIKLKGENR